MRKPILLLLLLIHGWAFAQPSTNDYYSDDFQYVGVLGENLGIELRLIDVAQVLNYESGECLDVKGSYSYHSTLLPISLQGSVCVDGHSFQLMHLDDQGKVTERFEGTWKNNVSELSGNWTLLKTAKTMPFSLRAIETAFAPTDLELFYDFLRFELAERTFDAYQMSIQDITYANGIGKITRFDAGNGSVDFFSGARLELFHEYSSGGNGTENHETFQLMFMNQTPTIMYVNYGAWHSPIESPGEEQLYEEGCDVWIRLMQKIDGNWVDVAKDQSGGQPFQLATDAAKQADCMAQVYANAIKAGAKKLRWDGNSWTIK